MPIREYLRADEAAFGPGDIQAMSLALDEVCKALKLEGNARGARHIIATRIIELARHGERSPSLLRDRLLSEAKGGTGF